MLGTPNNITILLCFMFCVVIGIEYLFYAVNCLYMYFAYFTLLWYRNVIVHTKWHHNFHI